MRDLEAVQLSDALAALLREMRAGNSAIVAELRRAGAPYRGGIELGASPNRGIVQDRARSTDGITGTDIGQRPSGTPYALERGGRWVYLETITDPSQVLWVSFDSSDGPYLPLPVGAYRSPAHGQSFSRVYLLRDANNAGGGTCYVSVGLGDPATEFGRVPGAPERSPTPQSASASKTSATNAAATTVAVANTRRVAALLYNSSATGTVYVATGATATSSSFPLPPGQVLRVTAPGLVSVRNDSGGAIDIHVYEESW